MEDLDRAHTVPGAADRILRTLEVFGFEWDGPIEYQSRRTALYDAALDSLREARLVYACTCSRAQLARLATTGDGEPVYPGTCRGHEVPARTPAALRFITGSPGQATVFVDRLQGTVAQDVASEVGDFVVRRRDGYHAYQLAVVVDDADQGVTEVVRGCDLLDSTPRQLLLQRALGLPMPAYAHLPVLTEPDGTKLSKRSHAVPLDAHKAPSLLHAALCLLRQSPPAELRSAGVRALWAWALENWDPAPLHGVCAISA